MVRRQVGARVLKVNAEMIGSVVAILVGLAELLGVVAVFALSTTGSTPSTYVCAVTSQTSGQLLITNCSGVIVGPEPDGSYYVGFGASFTWCAGAPTPTLSWRWANGTVQQGNAANLHEIALTVTSAVLTLSSPVGTATMSASVSPTSGTNSFSNPQGVSLSGCPVVTATSTTSTTTQTSTTPSSATSTSTVQSATSTSVWPPTSAPQKPPALGSADWFVGVAALAVGAYLYEKGRKKG